MARDSNYTLLIICEGKNTEPHFFNTIRDRIMDGKYPVEKMKIRINPEPTFNKVEGKKVEEVEVPSYLPKREQRKIKNKAKAKTNKEEEEEQRAEAERKKEKDISGVPPLKWVLAAQEELRDGTYSEVWVVFDNDNHPAKKEAFEAAKEEINGKRVNIAYSSIAFEYYLLLHFEMIYKAFRTSECRDGGKAINCLIDNHPDDCGGEKCIGGYSRKQGYWQSSKERQSLFPFVEDRLDIGFLNAAWLREESALRQGDVVFYDRNPFVTTDTIIRRLTGHQDFKYVFVGVGAAFVIKNELRVVFDNDLSVKLTNFSNRTIVTQIDSLSRLDITAGNTEKIGERKVIFPQIQEQIVFATTEEELDKWVYYFTYDGYVVCLK